MARLVPLLLTLAALCALARAKVTPRVDCVCAQSATQTRVRFAYTNDDDDDKTLASGSSQNYMTPGALAQGQPSHFEEGSHLAHSVLIDCVANPGGVAWIVQSGSTSTLRSALAPCVATPTCVADQCGPPPPTWRSLGPFRGDEATTSLIAFPATQVLRELDGPHRGVLNAVDNAVLRVSTRSKSSLWYASSQQVIKSTGREGTKSLSPVVLYMKTHPKDDSIVCKVAVTQSAFRATPSNAATTAAELAWRTNVECSQNGGADFTETYATTATPTNGVLTSEQANCLTITDAGVVLVCLNNPNNATASGLLRAASPFAPYVRVVPIAGGAFLSDIQQKPLSPSTLYAFGYDRATRSQFSWQLSDTGLTTVLASVRLTTASSPLLANGLELNSIKAAVSPTPAHAVWVCIVAQRRDPASGVTGGALAMGCSTNGGVAYTLVAPGGLVPDVLAPNPDSPAYPAPGVVTEHFKLFC